MKLLKSTKLAFNMLIHSKLRSWLTILGIVIGVAAVVIIISVGAGAKATLNAQLTQFGTDYVTINPVGKGNPMAGGPVAGTLTDKDIKAIEGIPGVKAVTGTVVKQVEVMYAGDSKYLQVAAMKPSVWNELLNSEPEIGRNLKDTDLKEVVIGKNIAEDAFDRKINFNQVVEIKGQNFRVVGINDFSGFMGRMDNYLLMNIETAKNLLYTPDEEVEYMEIDILVANGEVNEVADEVERRLLFSRHENDKDKTFIITTPKDILDTVNQITSMITLFLGAIAVISLIVGAVGVMNTMFTSVLEKTKEIGIMKSIGARNKDIVIIFLINAGMVGLVGGLIGCIIGLGITFAITYVINAYGIAFELFISPVFIGFALLLATLVGMVAGVVPAWRASKLKPVDALRYE